MVRPHGLKTIERPVLILLQGGEGAEAQRTLERAGYQVLAVDEVAPKATLRVVGEDHVASEAAKNPEDPPGLLMSASRAARLLRASTYAINRWQERGWLRRIESSTRWRNEVDLREAVLVAWLHNGPDCVSEELLRLVRRAPRALDPGDRCRQRASSWRDALGRLAGSRFEAAVQQVHQAGYSCSEIESCIARLAATATA